MKVWCKVKEQEAEKVEVWNNSVRVDDLKEMILQRYPGVLQAQWPGQVSVYFGGSIVRSDAAVPEDTTYDEPLVFVEPNGKKPKISLPVEDLLVAHPNRVSPPPPPRVPQFVSPEGWLQEVKLAVERQLAMADGDRRVEPMAVVRCSRGGKTRFLEELADSGVKYDEDPVSVIFVSFNDLSELDQDDQEDPLQALLIRIAFAALKPQRQESGNRTRSEQFSEFRQKNYVTTKTDILQWLGDSPTLLLVDELNNLDELTVTNSHKAAEFATFVRKFFLTPKGRFFVFTTHSLSTLESFGVLLDTSKANERCVMLQELPLVDNLSTAKSLNKSLRGSGEAIYYGLMPGLIYDRAIVPHQCIQINWSIAVRSYNIQASPKEREASFFSILQSLLDGDVGKVPELLHTFLDASISHVSPMIRWAPYHLEFVMTRLKLDDPEKSALAESVGSLCKQVLGSKASSGDGWEALFVLILLARCLTSSWKEPALPSFTSFNSAKKPVVLFNQPFDSSSKCLDECKSWKDLNEGITPGEEPTISIYYPTHASFGAYDAILVFSEGKKMKRVIGYQLKEGRSNATQPAERCFYKSFVLKGVPPNETQIKMGWIIPEDKAVEEFFGVSGMYWTPKKWKELSATDRNE